jgi:hypothetical protein
LARLLRLQRIFARSYSGRGAIANIIASHDREKRWKIIAKWACQDDSALAVVFCRNVSKDADQRPLFILRLSLPDRIW